MRVKIMAEILIIDPKSEERALLREQLESAGHDVMESAEPESGLAKAFEHKPDIVIASMGSSPTSGLELAYRVASAGKKPLPAFLLYTSAQFDEEELEQAVRCGVHGVIPRGADNSTVLQLVAASLDSPLVERRLADRREYDIIVKSLLSSTVAKIIEELRGAVEASKNAETQFQDLLEAIPDALVGIDSTGIIRFVNRQAESLFGYSRTEMLGLPMAGFIAPGDRENHESRRLDDFHFAEEGKFQTRCRELAIVDKQAREIHTDINISFVHFGTCLMILASLRDISGRVADEARRSRLEADLNRAKRHSSLGELAGGVAHDFNNLLGAILNYASIMESELKSASCGKGNLVSALADLEQINKAARTATQLTRRLLTFAKREVSQSETINVGNAICEARDFLGHTLGEHVSVKIKERFNPLFVNIDPGQFEQIL
ncbi:MAG TPA: PAS domain S-box protein, partial [Acidimicrobiales bacterium]|nr:PAS domain S-box protein [Acidimicrobiales bacterium]